MVLYIHVKSHHTYFSDVRVTFGSSLGLGAGLAVICDVRNRRRPCFRCQEKGPKTLV